MVPTRGQVITTEPIEERLFEIPHYGRHGFDYWHQAADGRLVVGGFRDVSLDSEFTAEDEITPVVQEALEHFVETHVGRPLRIDYRWAGIFGMVFDFLPVVGRVPGQDGVWIAGGYSGHGNVLGFACGGSSHARSRATSIRCSTSSSPGVCTCTEAALSSYSSIVCKSSVSAFA